jgi:hypothetical protein
MDAAAFRKNAEMRCATAAWQPVVKVRHGLLNSPFRR